MKVLTRMIFLLLWVAAPLKVMAETKVDDFKDYVSKPAYLLDANLDGEGNSELIVSSFGGMTMSRGEITIFKVDEQLQPVSKLKLDTNGFVFKFPNQPKVVDIDGDGDLDIIVPTGFIPCEAMSLGTEGCGNIFIFLQTDKMTFETRTLFEQPTKVFYHSVLMIDLDQDGVSDLVTVGERKSPNIFYPEEESKVLFFKGLSEAPYFDSTPVELGQGLGSFPELVDVDQDGDLDFISSQFFAAKSSVGWLEQVSSKPGVVPKFKLHDAGVDLGPAIMAKWVPSFSKQGQRQLLVSNHSNTTKSNPDPWESGLYIVDVPDEPQQQAWNTELISSGIQSREGGLFGPMAAPGIFNLGDFDQDGDMDVIVSGDGDERVFWIEQINSPGAFKSIFKTHTVVEKFGQAGGMLEADLNRDGKKEVLITSFEQNKIKILSW